MPNTDIRVSNIENDMRTRTIPGWFEHFDELNPTMNKRQLNLH